MKFANEVELVRMAWAAMSSAVKFYRHTLGEYNT